MLPANCANPQSYAVHTQTSYPHQCAQSAIVKAQTLVKAQAFVSAFIIAPSSASNHVHMPSYVPTYNTCMCFLLHY